MDYHVQRLLDTYKAGDETFSKTASMSFLRWLTGSPGKTLDAVSDTVKSLDTLSNRSVTRRNLLLRSGRSLAGKGLAATTEAVERTTPILARGGLYGTTSKGLLNNTPAQISRRDFFNRMKEVAAVNAPVVAPALLASSASRRANLLDAVNMTQAGKAVDSASAGIQRSISGYVPAIRDAANLGKVISQVSPHAHDPLAIAKALAKSPEARALLKDRPGTLIAPLLDEAGFLSNLGAGKLASLKDQTMNPHLKLAYDQGVQKALEDAGLTKESNILTKMRNFGRGFKDHTKGFADVLGPLDPRTGKLLGLGEDISGLGYRAGQSARKRVQDLLASRPVSAITGSRMKNLTGDALEAEKKLVDMARSGSVLGAAGLTGLGIYAAQGEPPKSRASNALKRIFGD